MTQQQKAKELAIEILEEYSRAYSIMDANSLCRKLCEAGCYAESQKQEWISVDERLPDEQGHFLIVNEEGKMITAFYTPRFGWFSGVRVRDITHWMPLPEAPKKGGAE